MSPRRPILMTGLAGLMAFGQTGLGDHLDHDDVKRLRESGRILPMAEVMRRAFRIQPGQLLEAELEREQGRYRYEITILDAAGEVHRLMLDAASGESLTPESRPARSPESSLESR